MLVFEELTGLVLLEEEEAHAAFDSDTTGLVVVFSSVDDASADVDNWVLDDLVEWGLLVTVAVELDESKNDDEDEFDDVSSNDSKSFGVNVDDVDEQGEHDGDDNES